MIQKTEEINGLYVTVVEKRKVGGTWYRAYKNLPDSVLEAYVLAFEEPSEEYGLQGGRISKLSIRRLQGGAKTWEALYDRGMECEPKAEDAKEMYAQLIEMYN